MRWTASHRTGAAPASTAGFTVGGMTVGGQAMPTSDATSAAQSIAAANAALAPLGLVLDAPRAVTHRPRGRGDADAAVDQCDPGAADAARRGARGASSRCGRSCSTLLDPVPAGQGLRPADRRRVRLPDRRPGARRARRQGRGRPRLRRRYGPGRRRSTYKNPLDSGFGALLPLGNRLPGGRPASGSTLVPVGGGRRLGGAGRRRAAGPLVARDGRRRARRRRRRARGPGTQGVSATVPLERGSPVAYACRSTHPESDDGCARNVGTLAGWIVLVLIVVLAAADRLRARRSSAAVRSEVSR